MICPNSRTEGGTFLFPILEERKLFESDMTRGQILHFIQSYRIEEGKDLMNMSVMADVLTDFLNYVNQSSWISVKDRLPEQTYTPVLVYCEATESIGIDCVRYVEPYLVWMTYDVTHWMPLPEPPKDDI